MDRYTHLRREDLAGALSCLPELSTTQQNAFMTGTDGQANFLSPSLSPTGEFNRIPANAGEANSTPVGSPESLDSSGNFAAFPANLAESEHVAQLVEQRTFNP
jgi:hypothetical protein